MANTITDNRTQLADANNITDGISGSWTGSTSPVQDTDVKIEGTGSIAEQMTNSERTILWNAGTTINIDGQTIYIWVNCGVVGLLLTKASGGFKIRFAGPTTSNYWDAWVGGSDDWPNAVAGGWVQFAITVNVARAIAITAGHTGGTPPANSAIQHIGIAATTTAMTKVSDNTWVDAIWRLPASTPGIIVQGRNGGTTDWSFSDIYTQLTSSAGCFRPGAGGSWVCNTPIQIGINDTSTHGFSDINELVLWDNQEFISADLYGISALGNAGGTTNITLGVKTGTGDAATGAQGVVFQAASTGQRFFMDFDDPNLDSVGLYGCSFVHGADAQIDDAAVEVIGSLFLDCNSATLDGCVFLRNSVISPNRLTNTAWGWTADMSNVKFCTFQSSGTGHALTLTTTLVTPQTSKGNKFIGYAAQGGTAGDRAIYNNAGGAVTINVTDLGDTPTYRDGTGASTTVQNAVNITITVKDAANNLLDNIRVAVYDSGDTQLMNELTVSGIATESYAYTADENISIRIRKSSTGTTRYIPVSTTGTITSAGFALTVTLLEDPNVV